MGNTIWVTFQKDGETECIEEDHSILCRLEEKLDQIAGTHGVPLLSNFFDSSEMAAEFIDEHAGVPLPEPQWYDPAGGLETIELLLDHISKHTDLFTFPNDPSRSHFRAGLIEELENCKSLLTGAMADNRRFHFAIIM